MASEESFKQGGLFFDRDAFVSSTLNRNVGTRLFIHGVVAGAAAQADYD